MKGDWLQFNRDPQHSGNNPDEHLITSANAASLKQLFQTTLPDIADGAPVLLSDVPIEGGLRSVLFAVTKAGHVLALDARTGASLWTKQNPTGACRINKSAGDMYPCYTTSSAALDPNRQHVYAFGVDGFVHKYRVESGDEVIGGGWPELVTLKPFTEKGSSNLGFAVAANGLAYLYATVSGYPGDAGDYQGHVTTINLRTGAQSVFNAACSDRAIHFQSVPATPDCPQVQSAIWGRSGIAYEPQLDRVFVATGNGDFRPTMHSWGDTVFALTPDGTGINGDPLDTYTPKTFEMLSVADLDLGSTTPAILPAVVMSGGAHWALQGGKDGEMRLLDLENLSGQSGVGNVGGELVTFSASGMVNTAPAIWTNPVDQTVWAFITTGTSVEGIQIMIAPGGAPELKLAWNSRPGGKSPIVAGGVLYYSGSDGVHALDPPTGKELWHDTQIGGSHWESPILVSGILYITDESSQITAYSLNGVIP